MKEADYYRIPRRRAQLHRLSAVLVFLTLAALQFRGAIPGGVRIIAAQLIAVAFIWFDESFYYDRILKRHVSHRALAWVALVGLFPLIWVCQLAFRAIFP